MDRKEAARKGLTQYSTGRPCRHGHPPFRYTATGICVTCNRQRAKSYYDEIKQELDTGYKDRCLGLITVTYSINPKDKQQIDQFVESINIARDLSEGLNIN